MTSCKMLICSVYSDFTRGSKHPHLSVIIMRINQDMYVPYPSSRVSRLVTLGVKNDAKD